MARTPDPSRKPALLAQIIDYLLDKPLASLSFRTLAQALDVSTFTLVYHFGTRSELLQEIVRAISNRSGYIESQLTAPPDLDTYIAGLRASWEWSLEPRNRQLQRLEFEAGMLEALHPDEYRFGREQLEVWRRIERAALLGLGLSEADAELESRLIVDSALGLQYDLAVTHDAEATTAAFNRLLELHRVRIERVIAERSQ